MKNRLGMHVQYPLMSKVIVLSIISIFETILLLLPGILILGIPQPYTWIFAITLLTHAVGVIAGLAVSAAAPNPIVAFVLVPMFLIPQIIFGSLIPYEDMGPAVRVSYIFKQLIESNEVNLAKIQELKPDDAPAFAGFMPTRWAAEGLIVSNYLKSECDLKDT